MTDAVGASASGDWIPAVLTFWFDTLRPRDWWRASAAVDRQVAERFGSLHRDLNVAPPRPSSLDADGHVAAVIVFDQFSRHLHRGRAGAYASDGIALAICLDALDRGLDTGLPTTWRHMLYMPLMHAEDGALQRRSIERFAALADPAASRSARSHRALIERFGRFPARNTALGRVATDHERIFLAERGAVRERD